MSRAVDPRINAKKEEEPNMPDQMTKAGLLETLHTERGRWEALLTEVGEARMTEEILASWWTVKDVIVHVMWYERQTAEALQPDTPQHPGREWLWELTADKRSAVLYTEVRDRPLAEIRADAHQVFAQLVATVEALSEEEVQDPHSFPNMPPGWQVWHFIGRHSYEGSTTTNRDHAAVSTARCFGGRPRRLGASHAGRGTA
jgi:hypothetical protein